MVLLNHGEEACKLPKFKFALFKEVHLGDLQEQELLHFQLVLESLEESLPFAIFPPLCFLLVLQKRITLQSGYRWKYLPQESREKRSLVG
jgi:hypothetical protein